MAKVGKLVCNLKEIILSTIGLRYDTISYDNDTLNMRIKS